MKNFVIPNRYKSSIIGELKTKRKLEDPRKKDFLPNELTYNKVKFYIARHFGFCFGVENAVEIAYQTIEENPDKNIYLLSEMIHNPDVNNDLLSKGIRFLMDTKGNFLPIWEKLNKDDIVIIPAFGTTIEIENELKSIGINPYKYNTTCPFVEKVWNRAATIGKSNTIIIHGKHYHEETRATFSHTSQTAKSVIVKDLDEAKILGKIILSEDQILFEEVFNGKFTKGFNVTTDFVSIGVVNQTTMLALETVDITNYLRSIMIEKYGGNNISFHFADTRDTLCYATNDNQESAKALLKTDSDFAIVIGGYNSSNTSHLVELLEEKFTTYFISSAKCIINNKQISHFNFHSRTELITNNFLPQKGTINIALTCGASCPDSIVEEVINRMIDIIN
ncbi:MAG: 4-hydroxy-3-methylbut-2-enyl diphosphate reductase [bacterium]